MITKYPGKITKNLPAGPVTVRGSMTAQDLTRLNRDVIGEIREMHPLLTPKLTNVTIYHAVSALSQWQNTARLAIEIKLFGLP